MKYSIATVSCLLMLFFTGASAQDSNWQPVTGTQDLQAFMSGRVLTIQESSDSLGAGNTGLMATACGYTVCGFAWHSK